MEAGPFKRSHAVTRKSVPVWFCLCLRPLEHTQPMWLAALFRLVISQLTKPCVFYNCHERFLDCFLSHVTEILEISIPTKNKQTKENININTTKITWFMKAMFMYWAVF